MKQIAIVAAVVATQGLMMTSARAEDVVLKGSVTDIFGHRAVVQTDQKKYLVNFGPKSADVATLKSGDAISVTGNLNKSGEVRVHDVTLADGKVVAIGKDKKTWKEWLLGEDDDDTPFTAADAKKVAKDDGYALQGEPVGEKKHFVASATKDGKPFDVEIHRDGTVKAAAPFAAADAKKAIAAEGYDVIGEPSPVKKHFEALARKDAVFFEVHAHRDGEVKEARKVDKSDPRWGAQIQ